MEFDSISACLAELSRIMERREQTPGSLTHSVEQLRVAVENTMRGLWVSLEERIQRTITTPSGAVVEVNRVVDVVSRGVEQTLHTETKTGAVLARALDLDQLTQDALISMETGIRNVWRLTNVELNESTRADLLQELNELRRHLRDDLGFSPADVREIMSRFEFQFAEAAEEGAEEALRPALQVIFHANGKLALAAREAASNSPDFGPAMQILLGPSGSMADAATDAARSLNLTAAEENLEQKIEDGVTDAMDDAADAAAAHGAAGFGEQVGAGFSALGDIASAVPQLYESVNQLGEAWDRPLESTEDYMNLLSAAGGTLSQVGSTIQAFSGVTQIATAAQAAFNAVMAMNPVVLVVIAVVALIAAIALLIIYWDQVKAALRDNPWIAVIAVLFGVIGVIVVIIAYWDEIKLAVLQAANFVSIQVQRIGSFFVGLGNLIGMVWDWIVATAANAGIAVMNFFITIGVQIQNFFIGIVNSILEMYNEVATSAIGEFVGLEPAELIPEVELETRLIPPREVPQVSVEAAFPPGQIQGGLEGAIAEQEEVVRQGQAEDEERRRREAETAATPPAAPAALPPADLGGARPALPSAGPAAAGPGAADQSVRVEGGITVNINAERLEADAAELLSDEIIRRIQERLGALRAEQEFRTGTRSAAPA